MRWNSSEALLLNSFSWVSSLSPDWYCTVLARYLLSFGHVPGKGLSNSFLVFSTFVGRLFRRLVLELIQRATIFCDGVVLMFLTFYSCKFTFDRSMSIFVRLLISSSVFFSDYYPFDEGTFWNCLNLFTTRGWFYGDSSWSWKKTRTPSSVCLSIFQEFPIFFLIWLFYNFLK